MTAACRDSGQNVPKLEEIGTHFRVTLSTRRTRKPEHDEREQLILAVLAESDAGGLATLEIARKLGVSQRAARTRLASLVERGSVAEIGSSPQDARRR